MSDQWLSIVEYARAFAVSDMTVRRRIRTGRIQAVLKEGKYYIPVQMDPQGNLIRKRGPTDNQNPVKNNSENAYAEQPAYQHNVSRPTNDITVIKSHPSARQTIIHQPPSRSPAHSTAIESEPQNEYYPQLPAQHQIRIDPITTSFTESTRRPFIESKSIGIPGKQLLDFCETAFREVHANRDHAANEQRLKIFALEAQLKSKDLEVSHLKQQIEDLQLLIKIIEKR